VTTFLKFHLHFLSREKKTKQKKMPVSRGVSHFPARRRRGRSVRKLARLRFGFGGLRQSARLFPSAPPMLGAGQRESIKPLSQKNRIQSPFGGVNLPAFEKGLLKGDRN
jgi:hypothetical protein